MTLTLLLKKTKVLAWYLGELSTISLRVQKQMRQRNVRLPWAVRPYDAHSKLTYHSTLDLLKLPVSSMYTVSNACFESKYTFSCRSKLEMVWFDLKVVVKDLNEVRSGMGVKEGDRETERYMFMFVGTYGTCPMSVMAIPWQMVEGNLFIFLSEF